MSAPLASSPLFAFTLAALVFTPPAVAEELPWAQGFEATEGYQARQAEYLDVCAAANGPTSGNVYGQLCVIAAGRSDVNRTKINEALDEINNREDTADFELNALLRLMALYRDAPNMPEDVRQDIEDAVLNFKYWLDEPGPDTMCWWSENHQILFHAAELVAGQLYPNRIFTNSGMTGLEHVQHALPLIETWMERRVAFGFSEWHSNVYLNEDIPPLLNLVDFAWDEATSARAAMVLDLIAFDFANNFYKGYMVTPFGRTYQGRLLGGLSDSISEAAWISLGLGQIRSNSNFSGIHMATSTRYFPPPVLEEIANASEGSFENRQRDGIDLSEGSDYGISFNDLQDVVFWWGMGAYAAAPVIYWTFEAVEYYDLWEDFFWGDVPFLQPLVGMKALPFIAKAFDELTRGAVLEAMSTYTWRTPHYQLSGSQLQEGGLWAAQAHFWKAVLDREAYVFTTAPGGLGDDYAYGPWTGGWTPRIMMNKNVGIFRYERDDYIILDKALFVDYTHAYFPRSAFDEVTQDGHWTFGRKGTAYVGLYSETTPYWASGESADYELIADGHDNVWIVELGSAEENGTFASFSAALSRAPITVSTSAVEYDSPSQGLIEAQSRGFMSVGGVPVDLGPYDRWDNRWAHEEVGTSTTTIEGPSARFFLDFHALTREQVTLEE